MRRLLLVLPLTLTLTTLLAAQQTPLDRAAAALGIANVKTLQFTASGGTFSVGQNYTATDPWPRIPVPSYSATIDYETSAMRVDFVRQVGTVMPRGGGAPFTGSQRSVQVVNGNRAWNVTPGNLGVPPSYAPQLAAVIDRTLWLTATPHGFVRAAIKNNATTRVVPTGTEVSFDLGIQPPGASAPSIFKMTGMLDAEGRVSRVQTRIYNPVVGDMLVETAYNDYKDFGGVTFPSRIVQSQDGFPSLELVVSAAAANVPVALGVPDQVRNATVAPATVRVDAQKLGEGAYLLNGGSHHSLLVEMPDHLVIVDLPNNQARGEAVIAKAKEVAPNKPVRFVVTGHHHWDHLGGIRAGIAEGATIVTHESNKALIERIAAAPHTMMPDRQSTAKRKPKIQVVRDKYILKGGNRVLELHLVTGLEHAGDMLLAYLPAEQVVAFADAFTPPAQAGTPVVVTAVPFVKAVHDTIQRLKLNVKTIAPFHGNRLSDMAELAKVAGGTP